MAEKRKPIENQAEFIELLEKEGELVRIKEEVSRDLEISEFYFRQIRSPGGGKALLFENVKDSNMPLLINAYGSHRRMELGFGRSLSAVADELREYLKLTQFKPPSGAGEMLRTAMTASNILRFPPKKVKRAPCQEVVLTGDDIRLSELPILKSWPKDGGRFITFGLTLTRSLESGSKNLGMYRLQQIDEKSTAMHWQIHKDGSHFWQEYRRAGKRMPVAVVIGADPAVTFSAIAPMPPNIYELLLAGFIRGKGVPVAKCVSIDLEVPAEADIILEGYIEGDETFMEGPFGDHTGYYTPVEPFPVFHITAITMRKDAVYAATVVGRSPQEDCYLAEATEKIFLPLLQLVAPEVKDQMLPWDGCFHNCAFVAVEKRFPLQARRLMNHLWGFSQMSFARSIVAMDGSDDLRAGEKTFRTMLGRLDLRHDLYIAEGILDQLDHCGLQPLWGGKLGVDATTKSKEELAVLHHGDQGEGLSVPLRSTKGSLDLTFALFQVAGIGLNAQRLYGSDLKNPILLATVAKSEEEGRYAERLAHALDDYAKHNRDKVADIPWRICVMFNEGDSLESDSILLWRLLGNCEPLRDMARPLDRQLLILDATAKNRTDGYYREWPQENQMDEATINLVAEKWRRQTGEEPFEPERP